MAVKADSSVSIVAGEPGVLIVETANRYNTDVNGEVSTASVSTQANPMFSRGDLGAVLNPRQRYRLLRIIQTNIHPYYNNPRGK